ncbi:MAG: DUF1540 domain-containing protein [Coriobacteriia bacterium]|nr:DUF1540 domain-containing protein [Coriobacteriia bacterium]
MQEEGSVLTCMVTQCSYNQAEECHAEEIQVGAGHATCDTFTTSGAIERARDEGEVGACDMTQCHFNSNRDCDAAGITVGSHEQHADCVTYRPEMPA